MTAVVRPATAADHDAIWKILRPIFRAGETYCQPRDISREAAIDYWIGGSHVVCMAEVAGTPLGTYFLCPNQPGGGGHVANAAFATAEAAQGKGIARAMLAHALAQAERAGFRAMQFNFVIATNTRAIALWRSAGFEEVGRLPGAFQHPSGDFADALVMYRRL